MSQGRDNNLIYIHMGDEMVNLFDESLLSVVLW